MMESPQPTFFDNLQTAIGGIVAVGAGVYSIWKGFSFSIRKAREVYNVLRQFGDSLDVLSDLSRQVSRIVATQDCYTAISLQAIWESDLNGHCIRANPALLTLIGIAREDILGNGWTNFIHPDDKSRVISEWHEAIGSRSRFRSRFRFIRPDGAVVPVDSACFPITDERGEVIGYLGTDTMRH
ncbi:MAG: PAS domain-containing protein [Arenimonas sp.]